MRHFYSTSCLPARNNIRCFVISLKSFTRDLFVRERELSICTGLACAGTGRSLIGGEGTGCNNVLQESLVRERDFTYISRDHGIIPNQQKRAGKIPQEKSRGMPWKLV